MCCLWAQCCGNVPGGEPSREHCPTPPVPTDHLSAEPLWLTPSASPAASPGAHQSRRARSACGVETALGNLCVEMVRRRPG